MQLITSDKVLNTIIPQISLPIVESTHNVFNDLMSCILEQQIHYRSTKKIFQKMLNLADVKVLTIENFHLFEKKVISNSNISNNKYETINEIVDFFTNNTIDWNRLSDDEVIKTLSSIKGIGKWTIDMILLYTLKRPNVFPYDDYHLKQIMVALYNLNPDVKLKAQMLETSNLWGEHKSIGVQYLLAWKQFKKTKNCAIK